MEFKLKPFGDDLNLYYVAVTRPKMRLKLPSKYWAFMDLIEQVKTMDSPPGRGEDDLDEDGASSPTKKPEFTQAQWNGLKVLFSSYN